ncbi:unnamed protein product [Linum tenue]|uniref:Uncharacterized protein n=1 Tax=Linum tenue TaxID=586396 RepID=A0AAV0NE07_9ROSI|nr:unnamed protein product [Linum tenue]
MIMRMERSGIGSRGAGGSF